MNRFLKYLLCLFLLASSSIAYGQHRNAIKHNVYGYLNFIDGVKIFGVSYERTAKKNMSWGISGNWGTFKFDETEAVTTGTTERLSLKGFDIMPEIRWYLFNREWRSAPYGFFVGPYARLMVLEESYDRMVSDNFDNIDLQNGFIAGAGGMLGYKIGTNPIAFEVLGGLGWGITDGFVDEEKVDATFVRLRKEYALMRLEFSVGFVF